MGVKGLNHAVLWVRDPDASEHFYQAALGFLTVKKMPGRAVFMRAPDSVNDHDLGIFAGGSEAQPSLAGDGGVGLYHLAWEVQTLSELVDHRARLESMGALVGQSDHGGTKSLYAKDPDGLEFEVMWEVPSDLLDGITAGTDPLDLDTELERYGPELVGGRSHN